LSIFLFVVVFFSVSSLGGLTLFGAHTKPVKVSGAMVMGIGAAEEVVAGPLLGPVAATTCVLLVGDDQIAVVGGKARVIVVAVMVVAAEASLPDLKLRLNTGAAGLLAGTDVKEKKDGATDGSSCLFFSMAAGVQPGVRIRNPSIHR
jgi:hypothetical protein